MRCNDLARAGALVVWLAAACSTSASPGETTPADHEATPSADTPEPAAATASPCGDRRAEMVEWFGMGNQTVRLTCRDGKRVIELSDEPAHGEGSTDTAAIAASEWDELWSALDAAGWRDLPDACPEWPDDAEPQNTGVDLDITDGTTTRKVSCNGQPTATHEAVFDVFQRASSHDDE